MNLTVRKFSNSEVPVTVVFNTLDGTATGMHTISISSVSASVWNSNRYAHDIDIFSECKCVEQQQVCTQYRYLQ